MDIPTYLKSLIDVTMINSNLTFVIKSKGIAYWLKIKDIVKRLNDKILYKFITWKTFMVPFKFKFREHVPFKFKFREHIL